MLAQDRSLDAPPPSRSSPAQLEGGSPLLAGRDRELSWLRRRWEDALAGQVVCALVSGRAGIGKTRLAAEPAGEAQAVGAEVLYARGGQVTEAALATVARAGQGRRPTLLVVDYADDAPPAVLEAAAGVAARVRPPAADGLRAPSRRARPARLRGPARNRRRRAPAARPSERGRDRGDRCALRPSRGRRHAAGDGPPRKARACRSASTGRPANGLERRSPSASLPARTAPSTNGRPARRAGGNRRRLVDLQIARERTRLYAGDEPPVRSDPEICPFRGLAPFDAAHAEYFFGRERLVAELVARLIGSTLGVVGPSGSGKSSAVRAGLLPALAGGIVPAPSAGARR